MTYGELLATPNMEKPPQTFYACEYISGIITTEYQKFTTSGEDFAHF